MGGNTGSTILARQEVGQNIVSIVIIVAIAVFGVVCAFFVSKILSKYFKSEAYLEKKRKRPTTQKDLNEVSSACRLEKDEKDVLSDFCRRNKTPNILYLVKDFSSFDSLLKKLFKEYDSDSNENGKTCIFSLRKKIFNVYNQKYVIKNTKLLDVGTGFVYTKAKGFHYRLVLAENLADGMVIDIPNELNVETDLPKPLEKISLVFEAKDGSPYTIESRLVRFQQGKDGSQQIIAAHTDKIANLQKREQQRADIDFPCKFNSVKIEIEKKGKKEREVFKISEKDYDGKLEDISSGGCKLSTSLPIKAGQNINIKGPFNKKKTDSAVGVIVRTTKRSEDVFVLHIKFIKIEQAVANRINAMVIHYDD